MGKTYAKGLVRPKDIKEKHEASWQKYGAFLQANPKVTAAKWDCRDLGFVTPIKDQGQCGSCWDFSGTGICEMAMVKAGLGDAKSFLLSEQYTLDCGQNGGCGGDDNSTVCEWAKNTGLPLTSDYGPYQGGADSCHVGSSKLYKISDWGYCDQSTGVADTQKIKNAMVQYGAIGCAIAADDAFMNNPAGTVFQDSGSQDIDHDIILVGWDDSKGAWLLRNSWGTSWCDEGYCWIAYGANLVGTSALWVTLPNQVISWLV